MFASGKATKIPTIQIAIVPGLSKPILCISQEDYMVLAANVERDEVEQRYGLSFFLKDEGDDARTRTD